MTSKIDRALCAATVVVLAALIPVIILSCATKNNDISNWIIALANVAMAVAAFAAYRKASQYLNEFFSKEGYTLAIRMVNENLINLNRKNELLERASSFNAFYSGLNGITPSASRLLIIQTRILLFNKTRTRHRQLLNNCEQLSIQMLSYGIDAVEDRKQALITMLVSLKTCLDYADKLEMHVMNDFENYKNAVGNSTKQSQPFYLTNNTATTNLIDEMTKEWNIMVNSYDNFFLGQEKRHIRDLFCSKKN
ncbi:hypothetical protein [Enterobacter ludwigii]